MVRPLKVVHPADPSVRRHVPIPEAPPGLRAKAAANLAALRLLRTLTGPPDEDQRAVLSQWAGWGALPGIFDEDDPVWVRERAELRTLVDEAGWEAARRSTLNAHYTGQQVASALWGAVVQLGFLGGKALEPGCGAGAFMAATPKHLTVDWTGVELDPTTAAVCAALNPQARVLAQGFERTRLDADFDLAIGNVPFGKFALHDPEHNAGKHSVHNHFVLKSLRLVKPGGLLAFVTSRYTLDSENSKARDEMAALADLVGAVRLPKGTFGKVAGTDVVADLLILRRRVEGETPGDSAWANAVDYKLDGRSSTLNQWFKEHPEYLLGRMAWVSGPYGPEATLLPDDKPFGPRLRDALARMVTASPLRWGRKAVAPASLPQTPADSSPDRARSGATAERVYVPLPPAPAPVVIETPRAKEGAIVSDGSRFVRIVDGRETRYECPASEAQELRAVVGLRDTLMDLLDRQSKSDIDADHMLQRKRLNRLYDAYVAEYGPLNRYRLVRTGRVNPDSGEPTHRRVRPRMGGFAHDPDFYSVLALEAFDPDSQTAVKAPIFTQRVVAPRQTVSSAESPQDALSVCLDRLGRVDLDLIAQLLGTTTEAARAQLGTLVYRDPVDGLVTASAYLSGDVRAKLDQAREAAARDDRYLANVIALEAVQPVDLTPSDIDARLGCTWIPASDVEHFARQTFMGRCVVEHAPSTATWAVFAQSWERRTVAAQSTWGTPRAVAHDILEASLNQRSFQVFDTTFEGKKVLNPEATLAAREKQEELEARFAKWAWEDESRAARLTEKYNRLFNSTVLPHYDGSHLTFPGMNSAWRDRLHQHQKDAVWQILSEPTMLLAHAVGAGKSASMMAAAIEMRRLGMVNKPCLVVPNHMLDQIATEFLQVYPLAKILVATKAEVTPARRKAFVARCATGDWDAIVITHSAFERIPVSDETRARFLSGKVSDLGAACRQAAGPTGKGLTVKKLELAAMRAEAKHEALLNARKKDDGVCFEESGIDYVFLDESVVAKNLAVQAKVRGMASQGSQRAEDVSLKLWYLRSRHGRRIATFATGTPITNTLAEMYVVQSFLQPERLEAAGVYSFDAWAANFGQTVTALELAPDGGSYRLTERFARFRNIPELLSMFRAVADVRSKEDMKLPVPLVTGGTARNVVVPASRALQAYVETLVARARRVKQKMVDPREDNMLVILGDGRKAALHLALVGEEPTDDGKVGAVALEVSKIYEATKNKRYLDATGRPSSRKGGFQLVFCDLGTPKADGSWTVYKELAERMVNLGIPAGKVRFVHDAKDDRQKAELFAACRDGRVSVLIGSTEKMGTGTNVQARMVAIHHVDCPWRPDLLEQREGRGIRQGNQNPEIQILRYVVEGSFDVFMWGTVERKSAFIHQVMSGKVTDRDVDDIGEITLDYAQVKALATGNPLLMEKAGVDNDVARLVRKRRAHEADQVRLAKALDAAKESEARLTRLIRSCEAAIPRRVDTHDKLFSMTLEDRTYTDRREGGKQLLALIRRVLVSPRVETVTGELAGLDIVLTRVTDKLGRLATLRLEPSPIEITVLEGEIGGTEPVSLMTRLENRIRNLDLVYESAQADLERTLTERAGAEERLGVPFDQQLLLEGLQRRQAEIDRELEETLREDDAA